MADNKTKYTVEFDVLGNNDLNKSEQVLKDVKKRIEEIVKQTGAIGDTGAGKIAHDFTEINNVVEKTQDAIRQLSNEINKLPASDAQQQLRNELNSTIQEFNREKVAVEEIKTAINTLPTEKKFKAQVDVSDFDKINKATDAASQAYVDGLKSRIKELKVLYKEMGPGNIDRLGIKAEIESLTKEIDSEIATRKRLKSELQTNQQEYVRTRTTIMNLVEDIMRLEQAGKTEEQSYRDKIDELAKLQQQYSETTKSARAMAHSQSDFRGIVQGITGLSGGLSALTGLYGLLAGQNENLQKIMLKVQSMMAITIGLQQVSETLHKTSSFRLVTLRKLQDSYSNAVNKTSAALVAMGVSAKAAGGALSKALVVTGVAALIVILGLLVTKISDVVKKQNEAKKASKEFSEAVAKAAAEPIHEIDRLSNAYKKLGDDIKAKEKFIIQNGEAFDKLGVAIAGVNDADNLLIDNTAKFKEAMIQRARATAAAQLSQEKYQEIIQKELEIQQKQEKLDTYNKQKESTPSQTITSVKGQVIGTTYDVIDGLIATSERNIQKLQKERGKLQEETNKLFNISADAQASAAEILASAGVTTTDAVEGSVEWIDRQIAALEKQNKSLVITRQAYEANKKKIDELTEAKKKLTAQDNRPGTIAYIDGQISELQKLQKETATTRERYNELQNQIDDLNKVKLNLTGAEAGSAAWYDEQTSELQKQQKELATTSEQWQELQRRIDELTGAKQLKFSGLQGQIARVKELNELIEKAIKLGLNDVALEFKAKLPAGFTDFDSWLKSLIEANPFEKDVILKAAGSDKDGYSYDDVLKDYGDYLTQKSLLDADYEKKRRAAGTDEALKQSIDVAYTREVSALATDTLFNTDAFVEMFNQLDELTIEQINILIDEIEKLFEQLSPDITIIDEREIVKQLNQAKATIRERNPFASIGKDVKTIFTAAASDGVKSTEDIKNAWLNLSAATNTSFEFIQGAINGIEPLKEILGDVGNAALDTLSTIITTSIATASAIKTAESSSVILVVIQAVITTIQAIVKLVTAILDKQDKKITDAIDAKRKQIDELEKASSRLQQMQNYQYGNDKLDSYKQLNAMLEEQIRLTREIIELEETRRKKKRDQDVIDEGYDDIANYEAQIEENRRKLIEALAGTDVQSAIDSFADALVEAYAKGEDAAKALGETTKNVLKNAVKEALKRQFLAAGIEQAVNYLASAMEKGFLTDEDQQNFENLVNDAGEKFMAALQVYDKLFKDVTDSSNLETLEGQVKGASEETVSAVAGRLNALLAQGGEKIDLVKKIYDVLSYIEYQAMLEEQLNTNELLAQMLLVLRSIDRNTSYIEQINSKISNQDMFI